MKKLLGLAVALVAILILVGCEGEVTLEAPDVTWTVPDADEGAVLSLSWDAVEDADGYIIYADDDSIDEVTAAPWEYDADVPAAVYGVSAYSGDDESDITEVDCAPVVTTNITVYGNSDPDPAHPSGIGFTAAGNCLTLAISDPTTWPDIDFYFNDTNPTQGLIDLVSPGDHLPPYNTEENASANTGETDFASVVIADAPGAYSTQTELLENAVYSLWIDPDADGWDAENDHFGKMKVESITGAAAPYTVVITCAYQLIEGLRWVVTE